MDRSDLEPAHRLRQDLARLHQLLCRTHVAAPEAHGAEELSQRLRADLASARTGVAAQVEEAWVIEIREQCKAAEVPFFFKQWGGVNKKKTGRELHGRTWDEMPS